MTAGLDFNDAPRIDGQLPMEPDREAIAIYLDAVFGYITPLDQGARVVITLAVIIYGAIGLYLLVAFKGRHIGAPFFVAVAITAAVPLF